MVTMDQKNIKSEAKRQRLWLFSAFGSIFVLGYFSFFYNFPSSEPKSSEIGIATSSPSGPAGGLVIPASCPSDIHDEPSYGTPCSSCGGFIQCGGSCSTPEALCTSVPAVPANLTATCNVPGTQVVLAWDNSARATTYYIRMDDPSNNNSTCQTGWLCPATSDQASNNWGDNTITYPVLSGVSYDWWVLSEKI